ncbi:MAG: hypothetical protein ACM32J_03855 [Rhizobacter sp.]
MPANKTLAIAMTSILIGVIVLRLEGLAWWLTGSIALYSDALESIVNVVTAVGAFTRHSRSSLLILMNSFFK